jgi:hypothetical protein
LGWVGQKAAAKQPGARGLLDVWCVGEASALDTGHCFDFRHALMIVTTIDETLESRTQLNGRITDTLSDGRVA